jgi:hypothetical protein
MLNETDHGEWDAAFRIRYKRKYQSHAD